MQGSKFAGTWLQRSSKQNKGKLEQQDATSLEKALKNSAVGRSNRAADVSSFRNFRKSLHRVSAEWQNFPHHTPYH